MIALLLVAVLLAGGGALALAAGGFFHSKAPLTPAEIAAQRERRLLAAERRDAQRALALVAATLPTRPGAPEPPIPGTLFVRPLASHQVVGFVPYWTLPELTPADDADATVLCFYGVSVTASGSLDQSGPEWGNAAAALASPAFDAFVQAAHAAGTRVLLTLASADDKVIAGLTADPAATAAKVAPALEAIVRAHGLDGVNLDVEGSRAGDREGYVAFARALTRALRAADPGGELMLDTYAGSAGNRDFFDVRRLAPLVDSLFVEGYDMQAAHLAAATAPLATNSLGYSEAQSLIQYTHIVPARELILGLPFYGYDFTTRTLGSKARLAAASPVAVTYHAVLGVGRPAGWDPVAATPYASFKEGAVNHETFYDDPLSLAAKSALAAEFHLLGVGAWAFGMEGGDAAMLAALTGDATATKLPLAPPAP
ncbi:MAG TPA: glycosyl hydrolase family 18 protein [Acidimicrobiales bacterium]|nr:glycosyl hydrolase family 18 protein [Acidimicrobiales bacterium]